jgi:hypothetical protein
MTVTPSQPDSSEERRVYFDFDSVFDRSFAPEARS